MKTPLCPECVDWLKTKRTCIHATLWGSEPEIINKKCGNLVTLQEAAERLGRETEWNAAKL